MYGLIKFIDDNIYYVCPMKNVKKRGQLVFGKYGNNYYAAELICRNGSRQALADICSKLNMGGLYIDLSKPRPHEQDKNVLNEEIVHTISTNSGLSENILEDVIIYEDQELFEELRKFSNLVSSMQDNIHDKVIEQHDEEHAIVMTDTSDYFTVTQDNIHVENSVNFPQEKPEEFQGAVQYEEHAIEMVDTSCYLTVTQGEENCTSMNSRNSPEKMPEEFGTEAQHDEEHAIVIVDTSDCLTVTQGEETSALQNNICIENNVNFPQNIPEEFEIVVQHDEEHATVISTIPTSDYLTVMPGEENSNATENKPNEENANLVTMEQFEEVRNLGNPVESSLVPREDASDDVVRTNLSALLLPHSKLSNKKYYCSYCYKTVTNFGRHLVSSHKNKEEVLDILKYPSGHPERLRKIGEIRKQFQHEHNTCESLNTGILIVKRRPSQKKSRSPNHYKSCPNCKEMFSRLSLRVHASKCYNRTKGKKDVIVRSRQFQLNIHSKASPRLAKHVIAKGREDKIIQHILFDELCIEYGNKLCKKYRNRQDNDMIRSRLRDLGRFISQFQQISGKLCNMKDILMPQNYDNIVAAINSVAGLNETSGKYNTPSTAYNLGLRVKEVLFLLRSQCIKENDSAKRDSVRDLLYLIEEGFATDINKTVSENQSEIRRNKKVCLPTAEDIKSLKNYLANGRKTASTSLRNGFSAKSWKDLAGFTLISLQLFNRRRSGEIERFLISDYRRYEFVDQNDEVFKDLEESVKNVAVYYARCFIRGKLNRQVPVILSRELIDHIDILLRYREQYGVAKDNPYVFGIPGRSQCTYLRACALMRYYSKACGAPNPTTLRGTELRKQIATACSLYNLEDPLVEDVANHLGHHVDIHKKIYRQSTAREMPSVLQILLKALGEEDHDQFADGNMPSDNNVEKVSPISQQDEDLTPIYSVNYCETSKRPQSDSAPVPTSSKIKRVSWSTPEKRAIRESFDTYLNEGGVPTYEECHEAQMNHPSLRKRTPPQIKAFVAGEIKRLEAESRPKVRNPWTSAENEIVEREFETFLKEKRLPSLKKCAEAIAANSCLKGRTAEMLKAHINNINTKSKKAIIA